MKRRRGSAAAGWRCHVEQRDKDMPSELARAVSSAAFDDPPARGSATRCQCFAISSDNSIGVFYAVTIGGIADSRGLINAA